jgi:hypothetical protein
MAIVMPLAKPVDRETFVLSVVPTKTRLVLRFPLEMSAMMERVAQKTIPARRMVLVSVA